MLFWYNLSRGGDFLIIGVLVEVASKSVDRIFDYLVPSALCGFIKKGIRVEVPFGRQTLEGFVLEIKDSSTSAKDLKEIIRIVDQDIVLNEELLELGKKIQKITLAPLISCYQVMLPKALKAKNGSVVNKKVVSYYRLNSIDLSSFSFLPKQLEIIQLCQKEKEVSKKRLTQISASSLHTLVKKNILLEVKKEEYRRNYQEPIRECKQLTLEQQKVVDQVRSFPSFSVSLLYGVTGSGKTEVYMELIDGALKQGKNSIMLVPEISLTPQMVERFQRRFGDQIAAIHSALSEGEKYDEWRRIARGEAKIVIGARSAIFAPFDQIGMIIIDEEHSDSYKQSDPSPRYQAKDVAIMRAKRHQCPVVLGSATPSLESMARALKGVYHFLSLPHRVNGRELPNVQIIDMNQEVKKTPYHITTTLLNEIQYCIEQGEQVILFLNRRGFSTFVTCKNCSNTIKCPNRDITLTYHKSNHMLRCHYCGYATPLPKVCPNCKEESLSDLGVGTEKIEEELSVLLPYAKVLRMDVDTTSRKGAHKKMIDAFRSHEYDILLGTQIVAKGLDFENVTLVGVINADTSLNIPDFRSSENTFSLLSQVAGRSGRSKKEGKVMIQTFNPDHYAIQYTKTHNYLGFYQKEMEIRKQLKYPPYYYLCSLRISGRDSSYVEKEASKIYRSLERNLPHMILLGPSPNIIFKMNRIYRYGIIIKYKQLENLPEILEKILQHYKSDHRIKVDVDFNPSHF